MLTLTVCLLNVCACVCLCLSACVVCVRVCCVWVCPLVCVCALVCVLCVRLCVLCLLVMCACLCVCVVCVIRVQWWSGRWIVRALDVNYNWLYWWAVSSCVYFTEQSQSTWTIQEQVHLENHINQMFLTSSALMFNTTIHNIISGLEERQQWGLMSCPWRSEQTIFFKTLHQNTHQKNIYSTLHFFSS